jgi:hypothetical protein
MVPTPRRWWTSVPDEQRPAWRAAARTGVLPADLARSLDAAGMVLARYEGRAFIPPPLAQEILGW